ncbi:MAG: aspartate/glutamate racemase family protein [Burkholderiales bacterium]|nr:aspartate/glutamate racemase family protein [Burkholderiales bacterium]
MNNDVRRIGVLAPPGNVTLERELPMYLPAGVAISHNRLSRPTPEVTKESLTLMLASVDQAARDLAMAWPQPEVMLFACTSGSFVSGPGTEEESADKIAQVTGIPAYTTSQAVVLALRAVGARRILLITPYIDAVNRHEIAFLEHRGIAVEACDSFGCLDTRDIAKISSEQVRDLVLKHAETATRCDGVFISCTNLLTMDQIEALEQALGIPVLTSNQCSLWIALKHMKIDASKLGPGRLFKIPRGLAPGLEA